MKVYLLSLGCDKNLVGSENLIGILIDNNYNITVEPLEADIIIVNTCGFIAEAIKENIDNILQLSDHKENNCKCLIVAGCLVERFKEEIFSELPEVDGIISSNNFAKIDDIIKDILNKKEKISAITSHEEAHELEHISKRVHSTFHYAYLKIAEGCNRHCTFCTIPSIKGAYRSRNIESLVEEAKTLAENGVKEIILVAQDTSIYGIDIYKEKKLSTLIQELSKIEELSWIRLMYCYPENIDDALINEIKTNDKVCKYIDMPIQHSEDNILNLMERQSSKQTIIDRVNQIRAEIPEIALRTTIIVGFPEETPEDINNLAEFMQQFKFDKLGVFRYSQEKGTKAADMTNQVSEQEKNRRYKKIMKVQEKISLEKNKNRVGSEVKVIVDSFVENAKSRMYCGRTQENAIEVDDVVFFESKYDLISGEMLLVKIIKAKEYDLIGEIIRRI